MRENPDGASGVKQEAMVPDLPVTPPRYQSMAAVRRGAAQTFAQDGGGKAARCDIANKITIVRSAAGLPLRFLSVSVPPPRCALRAGSFRASWTKLVSSSRHPATSRSIPIPFRDDRR